MSEAPREDTEQGTSNRAARAARAVATAPIVIYQRVISPAIPRRCKYHPTCSQYAIDAVRIHGPWRGLWRAVRRILRCHPWSRGGYDPA